MYQYKSMDKYYHLLLSYQNWCQVCYFVWEVGSTTLYIDGMGIEQNHCISPILCKTEIFLGVNSYKNQKYIPMCTIFHLEIGSTPGQPVQTRLVLSSEPYSCYCSSKRAFTLSSLWRALFFHTLWVWPSTLGLTNLVYTSKQMPIVIQFS